MKSRGFVTVAVVISLAFVFCLSNAFSWSAKYKQGFALSNMVKSSDLVVVGRVAEKEFVYRQNLVF